MFKLIIVIFYLQLALVSVSEEVRSRCHIRHSVAKNAESGSTDCLDSLLPHNTVSNFYIFYNLCTKNINLINEVSLIYKRGKESGVCLNSSFFCIYYKINC